MIPEKDTVSTTVDSPASHVDSSKTTSKLPRRKIDKKVGGRERLLAEPMRGRKLSAIPKGSHSVFLLPPISGPDFVTRDLFAFSPPFPAKPTYWWWMALSSTVHGLP